MSGTRTRATARSTRKSKSEILGLLFFQGHCYEHQFIVRGTIRAHLLLEHWASQNRITERAKRESWGSYLLAPTDAITTQIARRKIRAIIATKGKPQEEMWLT